MMSSCFATVALLWQFFAYLDPQANESNLKWPSLDWIWHPVDILPKKTNSLNTFYSTSLSVPVEGYGSCIYGYPSNILCDEPSSALIITVSFYCNGPIRENNGSQPLAKSGSNDRPRQDWVKVANPDNLQCRHRGQRHYFPPGTSNTACFVVPVKRNNDLTKEATLSRWRHCVRLS